MIKRYYDKRDIEIGALDDNGCLWFASTKFASKWTDSLDAKIEVKYERLMDQDHELRLFNIAGHGHREIQRDSKAWAITCEQLSVMYKNVIPHTSHHV